jgi:hypothetical protein
MQPECPLLDEEPTKLSDDLKSLHDPYQLFALPYTVASARDNCDAMKKVNNQGERHENELQGSYRARRRRWHRRSGHPGTSRPGHAANLCCR